MGDDAGLADPLRGLSLEGLFREHAEGLAGAARGILGPRADVAEVLQDAFLKAWRHLRQGEAPRDPVAWLFVLTLNLARDQRRRRRRRLPPVALEDLDPMTLDAREPRPDARLIDGESLALARAAIHRLKDKEKEVFLLRQAGGQTYEAIARALAIPVGTAKTRMRSALLNLRAALERQGALPLTRRETP